MHTTTTIERFSTTAEAAELLGKPRSWLHNNAARLGIPRYKTGNHWRYRLSEVSAWVEGHGLR
jgi:excisionase family DNA binding protein